MKIVVTTIQPPTAAMRVWSERAGPQGLIVVGDAAGPPHFDLPDTRFLSLDDQLASPWDLARAMPSGHYARKNIGYLQAVSDGASCIYETDDDNAPLPGWGDRGEAVSAFRAASESGPAWVNIFSFFTNELVWPRGLPLDRIRCGSESVSVSAEPDLVPAPVQQGLANGSPDADAVWRLIMDRDIVFDDGPAILLSPQCWCPFNSQSTWWRPVAYPLLYLPRNCSFRMCDIWRSFVAQRCLWELDSGVVFHAPDVVQERNPHDLAKDFQDELPGHMRTPRLAEALEDTSLQQGTARVGDNLLNCYEALVREGFYPSEELQLVESWLRDLDRALG